MAFRFSITKKVIVLVAIPLICELTFLLMMGSALNNAEEESEKAEHALKISDTTNNLVRDLYLIVNEMNLGEIENRGELIGSFRETPRMLHARQLIQNLEDLTRDEHRKQRVVLDVERAYSAAIAKFNEGWQACLTGDRKKFSYIQKKGLKQYIPLLISEELINLPKDEMERYRQARQNERAARQDIKTYLGGLVVLSILFTLCIAATLTLQITRRLSQLAKKTVLMASNQALSEPLSGNDEIKDVDRAFHQMVNALSDASQRERAILENARDLICSIDQHGKFSAINAASMSILGYDPAYLLGLHFIDIVAPDDIKYVLQEIWTVTTKKESHEFEARLVKPDRSMVYLLWSVRWSEANQSLFCVLHDVSARKEAELLRQELIAMVTHDLRTPLTAVRQIVETLKGDANGEVSPDTDKMLTHIETSSTRMMLLINDLLDIDKIESGCLKLSCSKVFATELFAQAIETTHVLAYEKEIVLVDKASEIVEAGFVDIELEVDPDRIIQVLVNLISNAIKFSPRQSKIELFAFERGEAIEFDVKDSGRGIPQEMLTRIFERFLQVERSDWQVQGGSGLGLVICKSIVELHGGKIWVESEPGAGSVFKFVLPKVFSATQL